MKTLKFKTTILLDKTSKLGHHFIMIIRPVMKVFNHISAEVHDEERFDDSNNLISGYGINHSEYFTTSKAKAITQAKEMLMHNDIVDYAFDNGIEGLLFN